MGQMYEEEEEEGGESPHDGEEAGREYTTRSPMLLLLMMAKEDEDRFLSVTRSLQFLIRMMRPSRIFTSYKLNVPIIITVAIIVMARVTVTVSQP
jgi:hypothetical protein